jgi:hypothetical protein
MRREAVPKEELLVFPRLSAGIDEARKPGDIENVWIIATGNPAWPTQIQRAPHDQKRKSAIGLRPVKTELVVAEAPVRPELDVREYRAEIVRVQLEEVRQERVVRWRRHLEADCRLHHQLLLQGIRGATVSPSFFEAPISAP